VTAGGVGGSQQEYTVEWALLLRDVSRDLDSVQPVASGSFDVAGSEVTLSRQGEFYRRVADNTIQLAVGGGRIDIASCKGKQVMVWMKPSTKVKLEISDRDVEYMFQ